MDTRDEGRTEVISISVTLREKQKIVDLASAEDRSVSNYCYRIIRDYLEKKVVPDME